MVNIAQSFRVPHCEEMRKLQNYHSFRITAVNSFTSAEASSHTAILEICSSINSSIYFCMYVCNNVRLFLTKEFTYLIFRR